MSLRRDNRGVTLTELIVVIALISILSGVAMYSLNTITGAKVNKMTEQLESAMERTKALTLGKEQNAVELILYHDAASESYKVRIISGGSTLLTDDIGPDSISIDIRFKGDTLPVKVEDISPAPGHSCGYDGLHIMYERSSGAFVANLNEVSGVTGITDGTKEYCEYIKIYNGYKYRTMDLVGKTGKIVLH